MRFKITDDGKYLQIIDSTQLEYDQIHSSFSKKVDNWYILRKKLPANSGWTGDVKFIDQYNRIPFGLWGEAKKLAKKFHFPLSIEGEGSITDPDFDEDDLESWIVDHFEHSPISPRYYQTEGVKRVLKFRNCTEEISTSGGKTLISYMIFRYLFDRGKIKKMLYVVPNVGLVEQSEDKFYEYDEKAGFSTPPWKSACIYGGSKRRNEEDANIIFGTFQSLSKKDEKYFEQFNAVCVDECLHPDTLIRMEDFSQKKIKDINIGEMVWTYNEKRNMFEIKEVEHVYKNLSKNQQMFKLEMEDGSLLNITGNHKVYTKEYGWIRVDELTGTEEIISFNMMNI
jgi:hypothetical protein